MWCDLPERKYGGFWDDDPDLARKDRLHAGTRRQAIAESLTRVHVRILEADRSTSVGRAPGHDGPGLTIERSLDDRIAAQAVVDEPPNRDEIRGNCGSRDRSEHRHHSVIH